MKKAPVKIGIAVFFIASFGLILVRNLPGILSAMAPDFTQVWLSAKALVTYKEPYLVAGLDYPNAYPPISEIFFLPLAFLSYHKALAIFTYLSFASIIGSVLLSLKIAINKVPWQYFLLFSGFSFLSFPTKFSLGMGQINMIVLFLLLLAVFLETSRHKSVAAGLSLGAAIALKPIFAFFLLFFAIKGSRNVVFTGILTVAILVGISLVFWSPQYWVSWYQSAILPLISFTAPCIYVYSNQGVFGFLSRHISDFNLRIILSKAAAVFLVSYTSLLVFKKKEVNLGLSFFIINLLLFDITSWQHHFVWLMFPFVVLFFNTVRFRNPILLGLMGFAYFLVSSNFKQPSLHPTFLLSTQFYGCLILWGINIYYLLTKQQTSKMSVRKNIFDGFFELLKIN